MKITGASSQRYQGITLTVDGLNCDAHWSRWVGVKQSYNPVLQEVRVSWRSEFGFSCCSSKQWEPDPAEAGPSESPVEQHRRTGKKCCSSQKSWGSICCSFVQSPTHLSHNNHFVPFRIKCERYIFLKNCVRSSLLCWLCFYMHIEYVTYIVNPIYGRFVWVDWFELHINQSRVSLSYLI